MESQSNKKKVCTICRKQITASAFARHLASHKALFHCQNCSFQCNRKDNYRRHVKMHQSEIITAENNLAGDDIKNSEEVEHVVDANNKRLLRFTVDSLTDAQKQISLDFKKPFTCKVLSPRGGGKTTFVVSYIQQVAAMNFLLLSLAHLTKKRIMYCAESV